MRHHRVSSSRRMRPVRLAAAAAALALALGGFEFRSPSVQAAGTVSLTTLGSAYTQDFDTLASSGTSGTVPTGWDFAESGTNANTTYTAGTGSGNAGDTYSFGASGSSERAFGGLLSGSLVPTIGAQFTNNTGGTITSLAVSYTGEQWRLGAAGREDRLDFQYSLNATSLTSGTWTDVDALDFIGPITSGTAGALDGNAASNRVALSATIAGLDIPAGASFWIRWSDFNAAGSDDGLAVDDFSITPLGTAPPPVLNEFVANHVGTDTYEYVEVRGVPNTDYSAYAILQIEGDGTGAGVIDSVHQVGTTNATGHWTSGFFSNVLENGTLTLLLVKDFTGAVGADLDTNDDGVLDVTPWSALVDDVAISDGGAGDRTYSTTVLAPGFGGSAFTPGGASRIPDGTDTHSVADWTLNDFDGEGLPGFTGTPVFGEAVNTPGAPNQAVPASSAGKVVISQIYGGGGNTGATYTHDFIELYNSGGADVDITGWSVQYASATGTSWQFTALSGVVAPGRYYLIQQGAGAGGTTPLPTPDATGGIPMSATAGKVALVNNTTVLSGACPVGSSILDFAGYGATANCYEGSGPAPAPSNTTAILRKNGGNQDTDTNASDFETGAPNPRNSSYGVEDAAPEVTSTFPANGAAGVPLNANVIVTFSEPVNVTGAWYSLVCTVSGAKTAAVSGGPTTFTLDPDLDFVSGESCTFTVFAASVTDQDTNDPPDSMAADFVMSFSTATAVDPCTLTYTPIYAIQGSGLTAAITGTVTTQGVVVGDYEGPTPTLRGFYLQDLTGDGDPATSDGIFVFNGNNDHVTLGHVVRVTGTAGEFQDQTQISASAIAFCGTGSVEPTDVTLPMASPTDFERYEGMLVRFPQTLHVSEHFQLGRFGQVVLSSGGRLQQPTDVVLPGAPANALQAANDLNRIILDDPLQNQNPDPILFGRGGLPLSASNTLRGGDTATGIVGVMTYTWAGNAASGNAFRLRPFGALGGGAVDFHPSNPRPTGPPSVGGNLRVASFNLLNYYNTFTGCTAGVTGGPIDCRGAENTLEFERQAAKTIEAIVATGADVVGLIEVENDGYGPDSSIQDLVNRLNLRAGAGTWAFIDADAGTGGVDVLGSDGIRVGLIYKPAVATPVGQTAVLNTGAFGLYVLADGRVQGRNRPSLAQTFEVANGARVTVVVNHLVSKGASCNLNVSPVGPDPDTGDGQGLCNQTRLESVKQLDEWLTADPTATADPDRLLVGDFNAYTMEDPLRELESRSYANLAKTFLGPGSYSYVFDGQWGSLDHAFASTSLQGQVTGVEVFHINADEPGVLDYNTNFKSAGQITSLYAPDMYRTSDHDPIVVGLDLQNGAPVITYVTPPVTIYEGQSTVLEVIGYDPDGGPVTYAWDLDGDDTFETAGPTAVFWATSGVGTFTVRVRATDQSGLSATASTTVTVWFNWTGFFPPVKNLPEVTTARAGSAVPVKFSLGGDKGLEVLASGFPVSMPVNCATAEAAPGTPTANPGGSDLSYDRSTDQYTYVWSTERAWAGTCRLLVVTLVDGTSHPAFFTFR
jgi:uncharacterized protein